MQTLKFDPGGFEGRLRAYPFLGMLRALLCVEVLLVLEWMVMTWSVLLTEGSPPNVIFRGDVQAFGMFCGRSLFSTQSGWFEYDMPSYGSWGCEGMSGSAMKQGT